MTTVISKIVNARTAMKDMIFNHAIYESTGDQWFYRHVATDEDDEEKPGFFQRFDGDEWVNHPPAIDVGYVKCDVFSNNMINY